MEKDFAFFGVKALERIILAITYSKKDAWQVIHLKLK